MEQEEQEVASAEETTGAAEETVETTEEAEATEEAAEESTENLEQIRKDAKAFKDQKLRAEKAEARVKELEGKGKEKVTPKTNDQDNSALTQEVARANERATRAELRTMGITHADDLKVVMDAAKQLGIDPTEAAERPYVKAEIESKRDARKTSAATPSPGKGAGGSNTNVSSLADKVAAGAALPSDPALAEKVQKELARRSNSNS
jgi:hypothetical protein